MALEFGLFTEVKCLDQALGILDAVDHPTASLLIDPLHLARSGGRPEDVARVPRALLSYAQFCDGAATGPGADDPAGVITEAVDGRLQVGEGALPLSNLYAMLPGGLPLSIELRSKALRDGFPDPGQRAKAVADATRAFLARHGQGRAA